MIEDRLLFVIQLDGVFHFGDKGCYELHDTIIIRLGIDHDLINLFRDNVAHNLLNDIQVGVDQRRRRGIILALGNFRPQRRKVLHV